MKPYLALFRSGPKSLHPQAVGTAADRNFDYALSHYGDDDPPAEGAAFVHRVKGAKWPGLEQTLLAHRDTIARYEVVWLPDDDLACDPATVSRFFLVCSDLALDLAQPALSHDSYFTHVATLRHAAFQLRFTNFVEIMAPAFSAAFLARALPTLAGNLSGYGLDALWPRMSRLGRVAIVDDTPIRHTRPICGSNYAANRAAGVPAMTEDWLVAAGAFIEAPADFHLTLGGLLQSGDPIAIDSRPEELDRMLHALSDSLAGAPVSALQRVRYLSNHLAWATGGEHGRLRYPREIVRAVLNRALDGSGIRFPQPSRPEPAAA